MVVPVSIHEVSDTRGLGDIRVHDGDTVIVYVNRTTPVDQLGWMRDSLRALWPAARVAVFPDQSMLITVLDATGAVR